MKYYFSRIKFLFFFYIGIPTILFFIYSCCEHEIRIIGSAGFQLIDNKDSLFNTDTIDKPFSLIWNLEVEYSQLDMINNYSNMATSCGEYFLNNIIDSTFSISNRSDFYLDGKKIDSGTNLSNILIFKTLDYYRFSISVDFAEEFLANAKFDKEYNTFDLSAKTDDGLILNGKVRIYFNL